ncbi:MAG: glycoside hydrolase family 99-like domain-containing protein, partial [Acidimicrobiales bacterium]
MIVAFYLPQFHPIPENDEWWGTGFTDWSNVTKSRPRFRGHYQPHVPSELGYYDLRDPEIRARQASLAASAGIAGFAYYHYWFNGHQLLEGPLADVLASHEPDFPFMIVWANENWTRSWDGGNNTILIDQRYSASDDRDHIRALRPILMDPRYMRHGERPVVAIYRVSRLPNARATADIWREEAQSWGLSDLYLLSVESCGDPVSDPRTFGFDAAVEFHPQWNNMPMSRPRFALRRVLRPLTPRFSNIVLHYDDLAHRASALPDADYPRWPGVIPGFDNSPRRQRDAVIVTDSSPATYQRWLERALGRSARTGETYRDTDGGFVFINAWNEWGEGSHLEPDERFGRGFLDATRNALRAAKGLNPQA